MAALSGASPLQGPPAAPGAALSAAAGGPQGAWMIPYADLELEEEIGAGSYGRVSTWQEN